MDEIPQKICQHFSAEECLHQLAISRAILIPQLLDKRELEKTAKLCETCEKCRGERRISPRTKRDLEVTLNNGDIGNIKGTVVDISSTGALIRSGESVDFWVGEVLDVIVYSDASVEGTKQVLANQRCIVKRVGEQGRQVAVMFLSDKK